MPTKDYLTLSEIAKRLGITSQNVREWCIKGILAHTTVTVGAKKRYFVPVEEFDRIMAENMKPAKPGRPSKIKIVRGAW